MFPRPWHRRCSSRGHHHNTSPDHDALEGSQCCIAGCGSSAWVPTHIMYIPCPSSWFQYSISAQYRPVETAICASGCPIVLHLAPSGRWAQDVLGLTRAMLHGLLCPTCVSCPVLSSVQPVFIVVCLSAAGRAGAGAGDAVGADGREAARPPRAGRSTHRAALHARGHRRPVRPIP